jgi:hypothetical protein
MSCRSPRPAAAGVKDAPTTTGLLATAVDEVGEVGEWRWPLVGPSQHG